MSGENVTPIRGPDSTDTREERIELAAHLVGQAVRAAILLIEDDLQPQLAADVLRLARDRLDSVQP